LHDAAMNNGCPRRAASWSAAATKNNGPGDAFAGKFSHGGAPQQGSLGLPPALPNILGRGLGEGNQKKGVWGTSDMAERCVGASVLRALATSACAPRSIRPTRFSMRPIAFGVSGRSTKLRIALAVARVFDSKRGNNAKPAEFLGRGPGQRPAAPVA